MNHSSSTYGKIEAAINSDSCFCGSFKKQGKIFCFDCLDELKDLNFSIFSIYKSGDNGLEAILDALNKLNLKLKD